MGHFPRELSVRGDAAACQRLCDTHLAGIKLPPFKAYTIVGPDKDPQEFRLYSNAQPGYDEQPVAVLALNEEGRFELQQLAPRKGKK